MATQARGLIRDQNLSVHFDVAPLGAKTNVSKSQKNGGGLGGRKALNDISNSGRPSALHSSKTHNSKNVISSGEEIGSSKMKSSFGGKRNASKAPEKVQAGGRKALSDLTNSGKPYVQQSSKDSCCNKLGTVVEEQFLSHNVTEEQLLHNHQECIKAQRKGIEMDYFLQSIGLETDNSMRSASPQVSPLSSKLKGMDELWFASNDIPIDVLSRLPLKTLLNVKCVSKQWHRLISERFFIRHQSERKEFKEPISGFFFQERFQWCDDDIRSISYIPVNTEEVTKVQRSVFNFLPQSVVLLSVSNGLICCRSCFPSPHPAVYICNPLNKEWVTLPWPTVPKQSSLGLAFDPSRDTTDESTNFKVVAVHQNESETEMEDSYYSYDLYSSKTKTWTRSKEICQCISDIKEI